MEVSGRNRGGTEGMRGISNPAKRVGWTADETMKGGRESGRSESTICTLQLVSASTEGALQSSYQSRGTSSSVRTLSVQSICSPRTYAELLQPVCPNDPKMVFNPLHFLLLVTSLDAAMQPRAAVGRKSIVSQRNFGSSAQPLPPQYKVLNASPGFL